MPHTHTVKQADMGYVRERINIHTLKRNFSEQNASTINLPAMKERVREERGEKKQQKDTVRFYFTGANESNQ